MRVFEDVRACNATFTDLVLTIGSFDGIHIGHQRIIETVCEKARERNGVPGLMYLYPHPREYFAPDSAPHWITNDDQRRRLLAEAGIEALFVLPFNEEVAQLDRQEFLESIVLDRCQAKVLVVGHDFNFGKGAQGNFSYLESVSSDYGLSVCEVPALISESERVSSTLIRELIMEGNMPRVRHFLGRDYAIQGKVERNRGLGSQLGYPTANIQTGRYTIPGHGIYVAKARWRDKAYMAAVNVGIAPTLAHDRVTVEAHLLDFEGALDDELLEIQFLKRLRPEAKFDHIDALIAAIAKDVAEVRNFFAVQGFD